ncbi:MAG: peptidylprolyl isomerase [Verrucomicrobiales bacterium]|nr:peptidylprolyl isomerase [Verrucomicrobiales bacterium]
MHIRLILPLGLVLSAGLSANAATNDKPASATRTLTELFGDPVVARGDGFEIKRSQLDAAVISFKAATAARGTIVTADQMRQMEPQLLQSLIQIQLLLTRATEPDRARGRDVARKNLELIAKRYGTDEAFERQLKAVGMTRDELLRRMIDESTAAAVLEREINVTISDEEARKFYEENPARFEQPERVRASHILLSTRDPNTGEQLPAEQKAAKRKLAEDLLKRARNGEDFAKLAREFSEDPGSKDRGGEYTFPRGIMVAEFESAAFSLNTNQISDIVTTTYGYHIIKLHEKLPARKIPFEEVRDDIKEALKQRELARQLPDFLARLKQEKNVVILDEKLRLPEAASRPATGASPTGPPSPAAP